MRGPTFTPLDGCFPNWRQRGWLPGWRQSSRRHWRATRPGDGNRRPSYGLRWRRFPSRPRGNGGAGASSPAASVLPAQRAEVMSRSATALSSCVTGGPWTSLFRIASACPSFTGSHSSTGCFSRSARVTRSMLSLRPTSLRPLSRTGPQRGSLPLPAPARRGSSPSGPGSCSEAGGSRRRQSYWSRTTQGLPTR